MDTAPLAAPVQAQRLKASAVKSTSIRVSVPTRNALAAEAAAAGLSLSSYLDRLIRQQQRAAALAQFRADRAQALQNPDFAAELTTWEEMDDGADFRDDGRANVIV